MNAADHVVTLFEPFAVLHRAFYKAGRPLGQEQWEEFDRLAADVPCLPGGVSGANDVEGLRHPQFLAVDPTSVNHYPEVFRPQLRALSDFAVAARELSFDDFSLICADLYRGGTLAQACGSNADLIVMRMVAARPAEDTVAAAHFLGDWILGYHSLTWFAAPLALRGDRCTGKIAPIVVEVALAEKIWDCDDKYLAVGSFLVNAERYDLLSDFMEHAVNHPDPEVRAVPYEYFDDYLNPSQARKADHRQA